MIFNFPCYRQNAIHGLNFNNLKYKVRPNIQTVINKSISEVRFRDWSIKTIMNQTSHVIYTDLVYNSNKCPSDRWLEDDEINFNVEVYKGKFIKNRATSLQNAKTLVANRDTFQNIRISHQFICQLLVHSFL